MFSARRAPLIVLQPCALVGISRSSLYDVAQEARPANRRFMRLLGEPSTRPPVDGVRRMTA